VDKLIETLRCPSCRGALSASGNDLRCEACTVSYPIVNGIPRMLAPNLREALAGEASATGTDAKQVETALSFGYEWHRFPEMYDEWERQFLDYMQPHGPGFFRGKKVLDAGCGNGRFAYYAAKYGAEVWAIDLGPAVEVAHHNTESVGANVVQADLHNPPFALESFDFIYSIGVLHHLPDPEVAFRNLLRFLKPGGEVQIYLYWKPESRPIKSLLLSGIAGARRLTTRMPHKAVHVLAYPAAASGVRFVVWPYRVMQRVPPWERLADELPMQGWRSTSAVFRGWHRRRRRMVSISRVGCRS
jgi:2-polyprenyl-3-methyl-5-hydroxy-6-metoxy-1,4-benzoquinol methylase